MTARHPSSGTLGAKQLIVFADAASVDAAKQAASELGFTQVHIETGTVVQATEYFSQHASPEILIVAIGTAEEAPTQLDALAEVMNPLTKVLAAGTVDSIRFYQWLSELGIDGYLLMPFSATEVKQAIAKGSIRAGASIAAGETKKTKLIAVVGARGGVGTTAIATNLAALFAREHGKTALVDGDPYFGCVALALDLEAGRGLRDAFEKPERVDGLFLERVMVKPFTNLAMLSAEEPLMDSIAIAGNAGEMVFAALAEKFEIIVADVPRQMNPFTRYILTQADHVLLVAEPQITSLRDSLRLKDYLVEHAKKDAPLLILNRIGLSNANELSPKEFAKNYGHEPHAQIAFAHEIVAATAEGELFDTNPKLSAARTSIKRLARALMGDEEEGSAIKEPSSGSLLHRLKGRK